MTRKLMLLVAVLAAHAAAQDPAPGRSIFARRYQEGKRLVYRMKGVNRDWRYELRAIGIVKKDAAGKYTEEYEWSDLVSNGAAVALTAARARFVVSLDPDRPPAIPKLAGIQPSLIGPTLDFLTFYCDLWLPIRLGRLTRVGDHFYEENAKPNSWADGSRVIVGEDAIDFDVTLSEVDARRNTATLIVRHVPPKKPQVRLPAPWMREPVADTPNNWVQVARKGAGYEAATGKETFDVHMRVSLADGKILSGTIENPVIMRERDCRDAELTDCGEPRRVEILRRIEIALEQ